LLLALLATPLIAHPNHATIKNTISQAASRLIKERGPEFGTKGWVNWRLAREFVWGVNSEVYRKLQTDWGLVGEFLGLVDVVLKAEEGMRGVGDFGREGNKKRELEGEELDGERVKV
ncbi:hypothetical protein HDV00_003508, partial [Rhizophlyctis rosea]